MNDKLLFAEDRKYSNNKIIRVLTGFPQNIPLPCRFEHGNTPLNGKPVNDLKKMKRLLLFYNKRRAEIWQKYSKKQAVIIGSPFVQYRRLKNICRVENPAGTIAYPLHSTQKEISVFDRQEYCEKLEQLPQEFRPIKICIHEHDFLRGFDKIYEKHGFEVVTAGVREEPDFVDKFYEILRQFKYATSNAFGSYLFYAVDMDIPFFIYGHKPSIKHLNKKGVSDSTFDFIDLKCGDYIENLFNTYPNVKITEEQRLAVEEEVGIKDAIDPKELYELLISICQRQRIEDSLWFPIRHPKKFVQRLFSRKRAT